MIKSSFKSVITATQAWMANTYPSLKVMKMNINAQPFVPKRLSDIEIAEQTAKKNVAQMYSYYNYLVLEKNKSNLMYLPPD